MIFVSLKVPMVWEFWLSVSCYHIRVNEGCLIKWKNSLQHALKSNIKILAFFSYIKLQHGNLSQHYCTR